MNRLTQLRFAVKTGDASERLHCEYFDLSSLTPTQRLQVSARRRGEDVHSLVWSPLINGERFSRSRLELGPRIQAKGASLDDLLSAIEQDESQAAAVPLRTQTLAPLAV